MAKEPAVNTFQKGLMMDLDPTAVGNQALTDAKNATLLTFNGNEFILQNDMGNTYLVYTFTNSNGLVDTQRVELPTGYIPLGVKEHGGVIYFVLGQKSDDSTTTKKIQIGSFPSPEFRSQELNPYSMDNKVFKADLDQDPNRLFKNGRKFSEKNQLLLSNEALVPTQELANYMFYGLNTEYMSSGDDKRIFTPTFVNTTYNQDITDIVSGSIDFDNCMWHITLPLDYFKDTLKSEIDVQVCTSFDTKKHTNVITKVSFTEDTDGAEFIRWVRPEVIDYKLVYKEYITIYISCIERKTKDGVVSTKIKYHNIGLSQDHRIFKDEQTKGMFSFNGGTQSSGSTYVGVPSSTMALNSKQYTESYEFASGFTRVPNYYIYNDYEWNKVDILFAKSFFYPNTKKGIIGLDFYFETVKEATTIVKTKADVSKSNKEANYEFGFLRFCSPQEQADQEFGFTEEQKEIVNKLWTGIKENYMPAPTNNQWIASKTTSQLVDSKPINSSGSGTSQTTSLQTIALSDMFALKDAPLYLFNRINSKSTLESGYTSSYTSSNSSGIGVSSRITLGRIVYTITSMRSHTPNAPNAIVEVPVYLENSSVALFKLLYPFHVDVKSNVTYVIGGTATKPTVYEKTTYKYIFNLIPNYPNYQINDVEQLGTGTFKIHFDGIAVYQPSWIKVDQVRLEGTLYTVGTKEIADGKAKHVLKLNYQDYKDEQGKYHPSCDIISKKFPDYNNNELIADDDRETWNLYIPKDGDTACTIKLDRGVESQNLMLGYRSTSSNILTGVFARSTSAENNDFLFVCNKSVAIDSYKMSFLQDTQFTINTSMYTDIPNYDFIYNVYFYNHLLGKNLDYLTINDMVFNTRTQDVEFKSKVFLDDYSNFDKLNGYDELFQDAEINMFNTYYYEDTDLGTPLKHAGSSIIFNQAPTQEYKQLYDTFFTDETWFEYKSVQGRLTNEPYKVNYRPGHASYKYWGDWWNLFSHIEGAKYLENWGECKDIQITKPTLKTFYLKKLNKVSWEYEITVPTINRSFTWGFAPIDRAGGSNKHKTIKLQLNDVFICEGVHNNAASKTGDIDTFKLTVVNDNSNKPISKTNYESISLKRDIGVIGPVSNFYARMEMHDKNYSCGNAVHDDTYIKVIPDSPPNVERIKYKMNNITITSPSKGDISFTWHGKIGYVFKNGEKLICTGAGEPIDSTDLDQLLSATISSSLLTFAPIIGSGGFSMKDKFLLKGKENNPEFKSLVITDNYYAFNNKIQFWKAESALSAGIIYYIMFYARGNGSLVFSLSQNPTEGQISWAVNSIDENNEASMTNFSSTKTISIANNDEYTRYVVKIDLSSLKDDSEYEPFVQMTGNGVLLVRNVYLYAALEHRDNIMSKGIYLQFNDSKKASDTLAQLSTNQVNWPNDWDELTVLPTYPLFDLIYND